MKWSVVTDSSCDILPMTYSSDYIELTSVPFVISVGREDFIDNEDLDVQRMLHDMEQEKSASHTSCPAPGTWLEQFEKSDRTFAITISSSFPAA